MPPRFKQIRVDKDDVECSGSKKASLQKPLWMPYHKTITKCTTSPFGIGIGIQDIKSTSRKRDRELYLETVP